MSALKKKSKMISIRVSSEEYESMRASFEPLGVRNISEFAREAMQHLLSAGGGEKGAGDIHARFRMIDLKLEHLQGEVTRLSRLVARSDE
jgi:hypothetical protein